MIMWSVCAEFYTVSQKNAPTLKRYSSDFDDFWQKYLEISRIEFACFSFHVGLIFHQLFVFQTGRQKITPILTL